MGAALLGRPLLALEYLEHGALFRRQGIARDPLQMRGLRSQSFAATASGEVESCCILDTAGPYHVALVKQAGTRKERIAADWTRRRARGAV